MLNSGAGRSAASQTVRGFQKKALAVAGLAAHAFDFLPCFMASRSSALGRQLRMRPELWGITVTPFVCADWTARRRVRTLVEHCRSVDELPVLSRAMEADLELIRLEKVGPSYRLVLHQVRSLLREGPLTLSLFDGCQRLFTLSFSIVGEAGGGVAYVGGLQGLHSPTARERYRAMTKATFGLRPRDLLIELFRALCRQLGVARIMAISDESHTLTSEYSRRHLSVSAAAPRLSYNDTWRERGGHQVSTAFFELPVAARRRAFAEIPPRKRKLYACRYQLLDDWERKLAVTMTGTTIQDRVA
jgi:uncharacterized protein VirK/YbjX